MHTTRGFLAYSLLLAFSVVHVCTGILVPPPACAMSGSLEAGAGYAWLSDNHQNWHDQYIRGVWQVTPTDRLDGEISHQDHFGDRGVFFGTGYTRILDEHWYASFSAGSSAGGFFLPQLRLDGFIYRKWLKKKNFVSGIGFTYYQAKEIYHDLTLVLDLIYYFEAPWIVETGARLNQSNPGGIRSDRVFAALTYGRSKQRYLTLRYDEGREAYQLLGTTAAISDFASRELALTWRQWLAPRYGVNLLVNYYTNPNYSRFGTTIGIFVDF